MINFFKKKDDKKPAGNGGFLSEESKARMANPLTPARIRIENNNVNQLPASDLISAIGMAETRGVGDDTKRYSFTKPSGAGDLALGKYQIREATLRENSERYLGKKVSPKEFLASPKLQDEFLDKMISRWRAEGSSDDDIISTHRSGPQSKTEDDRDYIESVRQFALKDPTKSADVEVRSANILESIGDGIQGVRDKISEIPGMKKVQGFLQKLAPENEEEARKQGMLKIGDSYVDVTGIGSLEAGKVALKGVGREILEKGLQLAKNAEEALGLLKKAGVAEKIARKYADRFAAETDAKVIKEGVGFLKEEIATTAKRLINPNFFDITPDAKKKLVDTAEDLRPELEEFKGKPLTHDEVLKAAGDSEVLKNAMSREATKAREAELLRLRQHVAALAEGEGITPEFLEALQKVSNEGTALGRQLESLKISAAPELATNKEEVVRELLKLGVKTDEILEAAKGVNFDSAKEVAEFYRKFVKPSVNEILDEYRYINLLSSPRTHITNAFTNMLQATILRPGTKLATGAIDMVGSALRGKARSAYASEVKPYYKGALNAVGNASSRFMKAFKGDLSMTLPDVKRIPSGAKFLRPFQAIPRLLEASDVFFRTIISAAEKESLMARAIKQGKSLDDKLLAEITEQADGVAAEMVFRKALDPSNATGQGKLLATIDKFTSGIYGLRSVPGVKWFIPFVQTPMNILKQGIEYSPAGLLTLPGAVNKTEQLGKALVGSTVFLGAGALALNGKTTWAAPKNEKEKQAFYASGRKAYSIQIGDKWISFTKLGPLAYPIAMATALNWYTRENPKAATDTASKKLLNVVSGVGQFFSDQSYVQGMNNILETLSGDPTAITRTMSNMPSQLVPLVSLQRWVAQMIDPVYRETNSQFSVEAVLQNIQKGIPFASKGVKPELGPDGKPSKVQHPGIRAFTPFDVGTEVPRYEKSLQNIRKDQRINSIIKQDKESGGGMINHF